MSFKQKTTVIYIAFMVFLAFFITAGLVFAGGNREKPEDELLTESEETPQPAPAVIMSPQDLQNTFRSVADQVLPVVVEVNVIEVIEQNIPRSQSPWDFFFGPDNGGGDQEFRQPGLGSGVIVREDGNTVYVLTNNHVAGQADEISVRLYDGREFEAEIVGADARTDLALVKFNTREDVPVARLGDSDSLYVGDWVLAVGNPFGFESTVTAGIVSALKRRAEAGSPIAGFTEYIQTDAAINPGNSGGALVNLAGEIIGINTWIASQTGGSVGLGFAIPINNAKRAINDFIEKGKISYGWLGVSINDPNPQIYPGLAEQLDIAGKSGSLIVNVHDDSPAEDGGLLPGDFITRVNGTAINNSDHLTRIIGNKKPGTGVEFTLIRYGKEITTNVTLKERGTEEEVQNNRNLWPGMTALGITPELRENLGLDSSVSGVVTVGVISGTPAGTAGLRNGDVITRINDRNIKDSMDFYRELNSASGEIRFRVLRNGTEVLLGIVKD